MEFGEIFRDAIKYPFLDYQKLLILGVLYVLINVPTILGQFGFRNGAVSIILLHNHPSGDPTPSQNDFSITKQVKEAGELIGIELWDHIIIGNNCYFSFAEEQMI